MSNYTPCLLPRILKKELMTEAVWGHLKFWPFNVQWIQVSRRIDWRCNWDSRYPRYHRYPRSEVWWSFSIFASSFMRPPCRVCCGIILPGMGHMLRHIPYTESPFGSWDCFHDRRIRMLSAILNGPTNMLSAQIALRCDFSILNLLCPSQACLRAVLGRTQFGCLLEL